LSFAVKPKFIFVHRKSMYRTYAHKTSSLYFRQDFSAVSLLTWSVANLKLIQLNSNRRTAVQTGVTCGREFGDKLHFVHTTHT